MKSTFMVLLVAVSLLVSLTQSYAQNTGLINRQATSVTGRSVLDPNSDGYTSATNVGFGNNDVINSEITFKGIQAYSIEPYGDLRRGPNHSFSDFVPDDMGNGVYHHFSTAQNVLFRMRMGSISPGSKGYSILMDTDGKFGASGPNADPNFQPATNGTNGNPGFEIEVVLETNFRIAIYNVDGTSSPVLVKQYTNWLEMSQVSVASTNDNGNPDFLLDFYIPFADLQAAPFNLTTASPIRLCATTVMSPQAATGGPRSDIYGTSGSTYEEFMAAQPACNIFNTNSACVTIKCSAAPLVNAPINVGTVNISGTWTKLSVPDAASTANITVFKNGTSIGIVSNVASGSSWTLNGITLVNGDIISAKAMATNETMCLSSNAVVVSSCNSSNIPATPILTCSSGSKGMEGTNLATGWRVNVDNLTRNVLDNNVTNSTGLFGTNTGTTPNISWTFSGGCSTGAPLTSGSYKIYYTNAAGCNSLPAYFCAAGNGGNALAGVTIAPTITQPNNNLYSTATKNIVGTTDPNATVTLFVGGIIMQTVTASGTGAFTFNNLDLLVGQQLYILTQLNTGVVGTSKCANQSPVYTVTCFTETPNISADNNNQLSAAAPITGTATSTAGTLIRVYNSTNTLVATTPVQANGTWSTGNIATTPAIFNAAVGISYYANAQNGSCGLSSNTANFVTATPTSASRCGSITGSVGAAAASVSGTLTGTFATTTVNLYLDGELIGSSVTSNTSWGPITVNTTPLNTLYSNGLLKIGVQENGKKEVVCEASATRIICSPTPVVPIFTPSTVVINLNETANFTISNAQLGSFYAISDSTTGASLSIGKWANSNGNLSITTAPFTTAGFYKVQLKSTSLSGVSVCSSESATAVIEVLNSIVPLSLVHFKGKRQGTMVNLDWLTAFEIQTNRFEIERSNDGRSFKSIGSVVAVGFSNSNKGYTFTDLQPASNTNFYRLRMVDNDGKFSYSNVLVFFGKESEKIVLHKISPNPFTDQINIDITLAEKQPLKIQLIDMSGRLVASKEILGVSGRNLIHYNGLVDLSEAIYFIKIIANDAVYQQKLLKSK